MTLRCALHARYSSDQQRAASIEDQFRVCRERAEREGWKVVGCYKDSAISGDSVICGPASRRFWRTRAGACSRSSSPRPSTG